MAAGRVLAVGASIGLHLGLAAAVAALAREPLRRALEAPQGSVEVGVVYSEPRPRVAPGTPAGAAPAPRTPTRRARPEPATPEHVPSTPADPAGTAVEVPTAGLPVEPPSGAGGTGEVGAGGAPGAGPTGDGTGGGLPGGGPGGAASEIAGPPTGPDHTAAIAQRLAASAARCYPRAAARHRAEGTVRIRFCIDAEGQPKEAGVVESSGSGLLDDAAIGCVLARAAPFPPMADCLSVPVRFRIGP